MSELTVATRYAKSLIDLAIEQNSFEDTMKDMQFFISTLKSNTELQAVLKNPIIPIHKKNNIVKAVFGGKVSKVSEAFFKIVIDKGRSEVLFGTAKEFINQYQLKKGIVKADVISASELSEENKKQIINKVKEATGGEVMLSTKVDPQLIGGFVLTVGDKQYDASIARILRNLEKEFAQKA